MTPPASQRRRLALARAALAPSLSLSLAACGGGGGSPAGPTAPPEPTYPVTVTVYYDENANGQLDASEGVRVPQVEAFAGSASARTAPGTGQAVLAATAAATSVAIRAESLPAYWVASSPVPISVPGTSEVKMPVTLPIGSNHANLYLGYGDSITEGEGSSDGKGYTLRLQNLLGPHFGRAEVLEWGRQGTMSKEGTERLHVPLGFEPAYLLLMYGTNDWQDQTCQSQGPASCFTIEALREIIDFAKARNTLPVLATIIPANPSMVPAGRNQWLDEMNTLIKALARAEGVPLADLAAAFKAQPSLPALFADDKHPNDAGYEVMARGWFTAITQSRAAASSQAFAFGFSSGD